MGLTAYILAIDTGAGRPSGLYVGASLLQGLNNAHDVGVNVDDGTAVSLDSGARWAVFSGLDLRLGVALQLGLNGEVLVRPTPGISWSVSF